MFDTPVITLPSYFDSPWTLPALVLIAVILIGAAVIDTLLASKGEKRASGIVLFIGAPLAAVGILVSLVVFSPVSVWDRGQAERQGLEALGTQIVETYKVDAVQFGEDLHGSNTPLCVPGSSDESFTVKVEAAGKWEARTLVRTPHNEDGCTYTLLETEASK